MTRQDRIAQKRGQLAVNYSNLVERNQARAVRRERLENTGNILFSVFSILFAIVLIVNLYKSASGQGSVTFTGMLQWLQNFSVGFQVPNLSNAIGIFLIRGDWGIVDGLRQFFNLFSTLFGVGYYIVMNLIYTLTFAGKFLYYILG